MRFVDEASITVRSGKGGNGCVSFRREKFIPKGGPNGGDGGRGGDVILHATNRLLTLYDFRLKRLYQAQNGQPGMGKQMNGKDGEDLVIDLPVGTLVHMLDEEGEAELLADLDHDDMTVVIARGGRGGKGNTHFKTSTMRTPRFAQPGEEGQELRLHLELKIIADGGLIGLPNAGKSTFISTVSAARPKIAAYPFTTLTPNLGVVENIVGRQLVLADIPGLIEGASEGLGLGHTFLKHVERTRFLVHLLSCEELADDLGPETFAGFDLIDEELARFSPELAEKPQLRVVSKIDLLDPERLAELRSLAAEQGREIHFISSLSGEGVEELLDAIWAHAGPDPSADLHIDLASETPAPADPESPDSTPGSEPSDSPGESA